MGSFCMLIKMNDDVDDYDEYEKRVLCYEAIICQT